jgi:hypothetical protein
MLTVDHTVRSYSGRAGCMCGCNGTYNESPLARKRALNALLKDPAVKLDTWKLSGGDAGCLYVDTATRTRVVYLTEEGAALAKSLLAKEEEKPVDDPVYWC